MIFSVCLTKNWKFSASSLSSAETENHQCFKVDKSLAIIPETWAVWLNLELSVIPSITSTRVIVIQKIAKVFPDAKKPKAAPPTSNVNIKIVENSSRLDDRLLL